MVKFTAQLQGGGHLLGIGLVRGNLLRLQQGHPVDIDLTEMGSPDVKRICILFGEDERSLREQLAPMIGEETTLVVDPRLKDH